MLEITSPAMEKLKEVLEEQGEDGAALRVIAVPGEGGGVQYMMTMEQEAQKDDDVLEFEGIRFVMDSESVPFLEEATIDYVEDFTRVGFVINNPNFAAAGGCGSGACGCGNTSCGCGHGH